MHALYLTMQIFSIYMHRVDFGVDKMLATCHNNGDYNIIIIYILLDTCMRHDYFCDLHHVMNMLIYGLYK